MPYSNNNAQGQSWFGPALLLVVLAIIGKLWWGGAFDIDPKTLAWEKYDEAQNEYVDTCAARKTQNLFPPLRSSRANGGNCGLGGHYNGIVCTENGTFIDEVQKLWDEAQKRKACVVYEKSSVTYPQSTRVDRGVAVFADDDPKHPSYLGLRGK